VLAPGYTGKLSAPCGVEVKVSIERIGPKGTSAGDIPGSSGSTLAVTLAFRRTCWAAGRNYLSAMPVRQGSNRLILLPKKVLSGGDDDRAKQKRADSTRALWHGRFATLLMALTLAWEVLAPGYTGKLSAPCGVEV